MTKIMNKMNIKDLYSKAIVAIRGVYLRLRYPKSDVYDVRDPRDFKAKAMLQSPKVKLKSYVNLFEQWYQKVIDQGLSTACTAFGSTIMKRIHDAKEHGRLIEHDPWYLWQKQGEPKNGDYLHRSLNILKHNPFQTEGREWNITGFAVVRETGDGTEETIKEMKKWLMKGHPIKTGYWVTTGSVMVNGSRFDGNMSVAQHTGVLYLDIGKKYGGHDSTIVGYDDTGEYLGEKGFLIYTPWGKWGKKKNGIMVLPYDQVKYLYTCYLMFDAIDIKNEQN